MAQAAGGSDEDPLVEFDLPALDSMLSGLVWFEGRMKFRNDSKKSRRAVTFAMGFGLKSQSESYFPSLY